jgi:hypothetical protein
MILRCPHYECRKAFDTEFNKLFYDKNRGRGYICPFCYGWVGVAHWRDKPLPRNRPHMSKKERRRQREAIKPATPAKESA